MFILKVFILIIDQLLKTANAKVIYTDLWSSDFRNESSEIFVLGVVFFQTNFDFLTRHFDGIFLYHLKSIIVLSWKLERYFTCDYFS